MLVLMRKTLFICVNFLIINKEKYLQMNSQNHDRKEQYLGWYHSHPGYKAFLSGTDVQTQRFQQQQGATLAVVIDPILTSSSGKVEIGGFRTYEEGYKSDEAFDILEMGAHGDEYYRIPNFEFYKSNSDDNLLQLLWNKYWANTLSTNSLIHNKNYHNNQMKKIVSKLEKVENDLNKNSFGGFYEGKNKKKEENELSKITNDSVKLSTEILQGLSTHVLKDTIFN
jgi:COP9 signalosome complex subunit 5